MTLTLLAGCKKHTEGDGHDHGSKPPAKADEHAGHDHGSESGGAEGHADEVKLTAEAIERYGVKVQPAQLWALKPTFVAGPALASTLKRWRTLAPHRAAVRSSSRSAWATLSSVEMPCSWSKARSSARAQNDFFRSESPLSPHHPPWTSPELHGSVQRHYSNSPRAFHLPKCKA